jgi:beta-fructofuranosidase
MDRRTFLLSSALSSLHLGTPSGLKWALLDASANLQEELRARLAHDPLRPQYHLLPQAGFLGDPCAPRFFHGQYHAFFHGNFGGRGWQHAVSPDLIHWQHMPIALSPAENSYDSYGTFTGSVLPGEYGASIIYTGVTKVPREQETIRNEGLKEVQCVATSSDPDLRTWHKLDKPVIEAPPAGKKITGFRDPFSWTEGDTWYVGVGSGFEHEGGAVLLYRSKDARHWEYLHPLTQGTWNGQSFSNPVPSGEMWECPDFFALGEKHVLLYSTEHKTFWEIGTFDRHELHFHSESKGLLDHGAYYAPKSMLDGQGRRILWGWVQETRSSEEIKAAGWAGAMSLPRVLTVGSNNELQMEVAPELAKLRQNTVSITRPRNADELNDRMSTAIIRNRSGEVFCSFKAGEHACGLELRIGSTSESKPILTLSYAGKPGSSDSVMIGGKSIPLNPDSERVSNIHLWVDGSIIEIFIDSKQVLTMRSYLDNAESAGLKVLWSGAAEALVNLTVSSIIPISGNRLTT